MLYLFESRYGPLLYPYGTYLLLFRTIPLYRLHVGVHTMRRLYRQPASAQPVPQNSGTSISWHFDSTNALQEWTGSFFQKDTLQNLGQRVQLGHPLGDTCTSPQRSTRLFTVLHTNGIHQIDVWFCGCNLTAIHGDRVQQLLRRRLFPATTTDPQTASSFALLESSHVLSVQSKLSLYDLYISIEILTDATRVSGVKVCVRRCCFTISIPL